MKKENTVRLGKPKPAKTPRKGKKPVKKISSRKELMNSAHKIMRDIVILRDKKCVCPSPAKGHSDVLQAGHLIPGTHGGTYFDLWNVNCQCRSCNGRHSPNLGGDEKYYNGWFIRTFGGYAYVRLEKDADGVGLKSYELEEMIVQLEAIKAQQLEDKTFIPRFTQQEILSGAWMTK